MFLPHLRRLSNKSSTTWLLFMSRETIEVSTGADFSPSSVAVPGLELEVPGPVVTESPGLPPVSASVG